MYARYIDETHQIITGQFLHEITTAFLYTELSVWCRNKQLNRHHSHG